MLANSKRPIGSFDQQVTLLEPSPSLDGAGQEIITWHTVATVWARDVPQRGSERFAAQQVIGTAMLLLELREYRADVTVLWKVRFRGQDWDIHNVRPVGRNEGLELECTVRSEAAAV